MNKNISISLRFLILGLLFATNIFVADTLYAQNDSKDSIQHHNLDEVLVKGRQIDVLRSAMPIQTLGQKEILQLNATNVADAANTFSGVTLKDYGGIGGLKTISVRGMDANYTGISYDGVMMSNIQSGHIDLGRFPLDNISGISLTNAQPTDFLQSARVFSNGTVLNLSTLLPEESLGNKIGGKAYFKVGSFGLINPGIIVLKNLGKQYGISLSSDLTKADGKYSFIQHYGPSDNDSTSVLKRINSDVLSSRSEINFTYMPSDREQLLIKTNFYYSNRGLPGSITFYNNDASKERLKDKSSFSQIQYKNRNNNIFQYNIIARHHYSYTRYTDINKKYSQTNDLLSDEYTQNEYYASFSAASNLKSNFILSGAIDGWINKLDKKSNIQYQEFIYPQRFTTMVNVAFKYFTERLAIGGNLLYTATLERTKTETPAPNRNKFSPTINIAYKLFEDKEYRIRAFYKNLYRLPTFNELYYQDLGNKNLNPENANMINIGFTGNEKNVFNSLNVTLTADAYYNKVIDKIVMVPKNGFYWSMTNRGKVKIIGADVNLKIDYAPKNNSEITFRGNYSFQQAKDATPESDNFGEQIPYMPIHSGNASLSYNTKKWEIGYNFTYSGTRWIGQMTEIRNRMKPYATHSLFVQTQYKKWQAKGEIINLLNTQYEIVKFYPMPRRNYRLSLIYNF